MKVNSVTSGGNDQRLPVCLTPAISCAAFNVSHPVQTGAKRLCRCSAWDHGLVALLEQMFPRRPLCLGLAQSQSQSVELVDVLAAFRQARPNRMADVRSSPERAHMGRRAE